MSNYSLVKTLADGEVLVAIYETKDVERALSGMLKKVRDTAEVSEYDIVVASRKILEHAGVGSKTKAKAKVKGNYTETMKRFRKLQEAGKLHLMFKGGKIYNPDGSVYVG